jgi:hypothetical protein
MLFFALFIVIVAIAVVVDVAATRGPVPLISSDALADPMSVVCPGAHHTGNSP